MRFALLQGVGRGWERMRLCIYKKFPLYRVKRQFPILSQNNYSMIVGVCIHHSNHTFHLVNLLLQVSTLHISHIYHSPTYPPQKKNNYTCYFLNLMLKVCTLHNIMLARSELAIQVPTPCFYKFLSLEVGFLGIILSLMFS